MTLYSDGEKYGIHGLIVDLLVRYPVLHELTVLTVNVHGLTAVHCDSEHEKSFVFGPVVEPEIA